MTKKALQLYYNNGQVFPSDAMPARLESYTYSSKRMGNAPTIQGTLQYPTCLDGYWSDRYDVYVEYNGEHYYLDQTPTSSKDNTTLTYKHELNFVSERILLEHTLFLDVVSPDTPEPFLDRARSNETKFQFYGNLYELASRINDSLVYTDTKYTLKFKEGFPEDLMNGEAKEVSFDAQTHFEVLNQMAETFEVGYYFVGKEIFVGEFQANIETPIEYGSKGGLLSVTKTNSNETIVDRITGVGGDKNVPYYYPNPTPYGTLDFEVKGFNKSLVQGIQRTKLERQIPNWEKKTLSYYSHIYGFNGNSSAKFPFEFSRVGRTWTEKDTTITINGKVGATYYLRFKVTVSSDEYFNDKNVASFIKREIRADFGRGEETITQYSSFVYSVSFDNTDTITLPVKIRLSMEAAITASNVKGNIEIDLETTSIGDLKRRGWMLGDTYYPYDDLGIILKNFKDIHVGDTITVNSIQYVQPMTNIMPAIYFESDRNERFYNADREPHYHSDNPKVDIDYKERYPDFDFEYPNPYKQLFAHEHKEDFEDIYPTIKDMENIDDLHIGEVADVMFDDHDDDSMKCETDENSESTDYNHPYFYMKIHRTAFGKRDGKDYTSYSFNLFDQAIENESMKICMTSGDCAGCEFEVKTWKPIESKETGALIFRNPIRLGSDGRPIAGDSDIKVVPYNKPEQIDDSMQDSSQNEVWLVLSKENSTFSHVMPNKAYNAKPKAGDKFVIIGITMPQAFIRDAEYRLEEALIRYMREHNEEKFNFSAHFSRVFIANNPTLFANLNENSLVPVIYNGVKHDLYVTSYSCKADTNCLYDVTLELGEEMKARENAIAKMIKAAATRSANDASKKSSRAQLSAMNAAIVYTDTQINRIKSSVGITDDSGGGGSTGGGGSDNTLNDRINDLANGLDGLRGDINGLNDTIGGLGDTFLHKDREDTATEKITFEKGLAVGNGQYDFAANGDLTAHDIYADGTIYGEDIEANGSVRTPVLYSDTIDNTGGITTQDLTVTGSAHFFELVIDKARATNGMMVQSPANASIVKVGKQLLSQKYDLYFLAENDGDTITNDFMVGDQIYCQTFNIDAAQQRFYWVLCTDVSDSPVRMMLNVGGEDVEKQCHRITVDFGQSASNCNAYPQIGDDIVVLGHQNIGMLRAERTGTVYDIPESESDVVFVGEEMDEYYSFSDLQYEESDKADVHNERCSATIISSVASGFLGLRQTEENELGVHPLLEAPMFVQLHDITSFNYSASRNNGNVISNNYNSFRGDFKSKTLGKTLDDAISQGVTLQQDFNTILGNVIYDESGVPVGFTGLISGVTEHMVASAVVAQVEGKYAKVEAAVLRNPETGELESDVILTGDKVQMNFDNLQIDKEGNASFGGDVTCKSLEYTQYTDYDIRHYKDEALDYYWVYIHNESFVVVPSKIEGQECSAIRLPILEDGHTREIVVFKAFPGLYADFSARLAPTGGQVSPGDSAQEGTDSKEQESEKTETGELEDRTTVDEFEDKVTTLPDNSSQEVDAPQLTAFCDDVYDEEGRLENAVIIARSTTDNWGITQNAELKGVGFKFLGYRPHGCATTYWTIQSYNSMVHNLL